MSIIFPTYSEKKSLSKSKQKKFCIWQIVTKCERKRMRKLALSDEILLSVDKAARYIGGEGCLRDRHVQPWYDASL